MRAALIVLAVLPLAALVAAERTPEAALINTIDRTFQSRFETIDLKAFGMRRIPVVPEHEEFNRFKPENIEDRRIIQSLTERGWEAAFFVAGRGAILVAREAAKKPVARAKPVGVPAEGIEYMLHSPVSKPVRLNSPRAGGAPLPSPDDLLPHVPSAFRDFAAKRGTHTFKESGWFVVARPVPASKRECLSCHEFDESGKALKVGDPLGVAFYAFASAGEGKGVTSMPKRKQQTGSLR